MDKIDLNRARPERSEKRKITNEELIRFTLRIPPELKKQISGEAARLGLSDNLYINAILKTRDLKKIKKTLE